MPSGAGPESAGVPQARPKAVQLIRAGVSQLHSSIAFVAQRKLSFEDEQGRRRTRQVHEGLAQLRCALYRVVGIAQRFAHLSQVLGTARMPALARGKESLARHQQGVNPADGQHRDYQQRVLMKVHGEAALRG